ncbi:tRNA-binding region domain protein, partial [mine drainage metagenome]
IREASDHPDADKLFILKVDLGDREIQLVVGLRKNYTADQVAGRRIVVVSNLKHSRIRGQASEGMLLAADDGEAVRFLTVDDSIPVGSAVMIGGESFADSGEISIDDLQKFGIRVSLRSGANTVIADLDGKEAVLTADAKLVFPERQVKDGAIVR